MVRPRGQPTVRGGIGRDGRRDADFLPNRPAPVNPMRLFWERESSAKIRRRIAARVAMGAWPGYNRRGSRRNCSLQTSRGLCLLGSCMNTTSLGLLERLKHATPDALEWRKLRDIYAPMIRHWLSRP